MSLGEFSTMLFCWDRSLRFGRDDKTGRQDDASWRYTERLESWVVGYAGDEDIERHAGQTEYHLHLHCLGGRKLGAKG